MLPNRAIKKYLMSWPDVKLIKQTTMNKLDNNYHASPHSSGNLLFMYHDEILVSKDDDAAYVLSSILGHYSLPSKYI